jgi:hypothetical protein
VTTNTNVPHDLYIPNYLDVTHALINSMTVPKSNNIRASGVCVIELSKNYHNDVYLQLNCFLYNIRLGNYISKLYFSRKRLLGLVINISNICLVDNAHCLFNVLGLPGDFIGCKIKTTVFADNSKWPPSLSEDKDFVVGLLHIGISPLLLYIHQLEYICYSPISWESNIITSVL